MEKKKKRKKSRYAVSRYAFTSLSVTPLRVLLTTLNFVTNYDAMNCTTQLSRCTWVASRKFDFVAVLKL